MSDYGIVIASHSKEIASGIYQLLQEVARDVSITIAGGLDDGSIGTSFEAIMTAVEANTADKLLTFFDLGSARMNLEMVAEMTTKEMTLFSVPVVEGSYTAAALLQAGASFEAIEEQLNQMTMEK
ncbi:MAG: PTS-dependent dihydroxyacetone kinase phosphotransferase subunit DhaM [Streptococcaceae bacterium]|jgi:dihydroxyacetone kinase phosphotransfer subunit|nr:PTS-dependent dihydroxyacetone kinase phosphotransferase subunit DhaM [Streptococcaceae bacterium]